MSNAIKFTHQGAVNVTVDVIQREEQRAVIEFRVQDTGIGIRADQQELIFTRFCRLYPAYEGQYTGAGLGLTVVKQFVEELNGEIHVNSEENNGSIFSCILPLRIPLSTDAAHTRSIASPKSPKDFTLKNSVVSFKSKSFDSPGNTLSILMVEDHQIIQQIVKNLFKSFGLEVDTADDGAQALEKIQKQDYALIIMDLGLPDQDGYEVTTKVHQWQREHQRPLSLVVALSAHLGEAERQRCLSVGMVSAYEKPLQRETVEELLAMIKNPAISKKSPHFSHQSTQKGNRHESH